MDRYHEYEPEVPLRMRQTSAGAAAQTASSSAATPSIAKKCMHRSIRHTSIIILLVSEILALRVGRGLALLALGNGQVQLELRRQIVLGVQPVAEVHAADPAVRVDLMRHQHNSHHVTTAPGRGASQCSWCRMRGG